MIYQSSDSKFTLFNKDNADLYYMHKQNIVGGPSIIFSRYHEKDVTKIKQSDKICKAIVGYYCNGLYSYAYIRCKFLNNFRPEVSKKYIDKYLFTINLIANMR